LGRGSAPDMSLGSLLEGFGSLAIILGHCNFSERSFRPIRNIPYLHRVSLELLFDLGAIGLFGPVLELGSPDNVRTDRRGCSMSCFPLLTSLGAGEEPFPAPQFAKQCCVRRYPL